MRGEAYVKLIAWEVQKRLEYHREKGRIQDISWEEASLILREEIDEHHTEWAEALSYLEEGYEIPGGVAHRLLSETVDLMCALVIQTAAYGLAQRVHPGIEGTE